MLAGLAAEGGAAPSGGRAVLTSATYPNHASFVTGTDAVGHGLYANHVVRDGRVRRAYDVGPSAPTVFDACRDAGRTAVAVFGDHHLVPVMGAGAAATHWPPDGVLPDGRRLDDFGYLHDAETIVPLCAAAAAPFDLLVCQLNGPDTAAHLHGPDSAAAKAIYTETDGFVGRAGRGAPAGVGRHGPARRQRSRPDDAVRRRAHRPAGCGPGRGRGGDDRARGRRRGRRRRRRTGRLVAPRGRRVGGHGGAGSRAAVRVRGARPLVRAGRHRGRPQGHPRRVGHPGPGGDRGRWPSGGAPARCPAWLVGCRTPPTGRSPSPSSSTSTSRPPPAAPS